MIDNSRGREEATSSLPLGYSASHVGSLRLPVRAPPRRRRCIQPAPGQHRDSYDAGMATREARHGTSAHLDVGVATHPTARTGGSTTLPVSGAVQHALFTSTPGCAARLPSRRRRVRIPARLPLVHGGLNEKLTRIGPPQTARPIFKKSPSPPSKPLSPGAGCPGCTQNHT